MKQDEIIEMAEQAHLGVTLTHDGEIGQFIEGSNWTEELVVFAKLVAAKEQEDIIQIIKETLFDDCFQADVIDAIRARGEQA